MQDLPEKLNQKLKDRAAENAIRQLPKNFGLIDFSSNDYLGYAKNETIYSDTFQLLLKKGVHQNGATGSRLLSGNHDLYVHLEEFLQHFHNSKSALVFNSGYDANIGFFGAVPQRGDFILYDEYIHASIRDGIQMSHAKHYKFKHNHIEDLKKGIERCENISASNANIYVVTESVFSMDGDSPDLKALVKICEECQCHLVVDEAHAVGVYGKKGEGLVQQLGLENKIFTRIITFGKAIGCHGAAILGSKALKDYLVNFARSLIYTTGLSPHSIATVHAAYSYMKKCEGHDQELLLGNIDFFHKKVKKLGLTKHFVTSSSAIQSCIVPGNDTVKSISRKLIQKGFDVKAILYPTVPKGQERLRFCLHSYNSKEEIGLVLELLSAYI
ncbi:aminotransferase class I/II-fold pyridoxal phosphate-dependent enzyme [Costertonia aggregata]|uniref:Pyridoxal phosphate-dependent aminotransferase family protein n=1 Tax=Costertonia aggregata TaxID=343403 RepID=A0A7H9AQB7_9FLAO|nr:pyridoxal phosphate-dependent aminotransferase family protein [Costertonia aggregata]QLG45597.1 pyridoxal phosphate-dependent aminotransferase family protein [Costertonia aggregata]